MLIGLDLKMELVWGEFDIEIEKLKLKEMLGQTFENAILFGIC